LKKEQGKKKWGGRRMTETNLPLGTPRPRVEIIPTASAAKVKDGADDSRGCARAALRLAIV
jgi:hypothetical protein